MGTASRDGQQRGSSRPADIVPLVVIALGGFAGASARYGLVELVPTTAIPAGTLIANALGAFALGILLYEVRLGGRLSRETRLLVGTGFLGSFTTYSTFAVETASVSPRLAVLNVGANYALGFMAVLAGRAVARVIAP